MKINKILIAVSSLLLVSCSSVKQPETVYEMPDYTEEDVKKEEIKRIQDLMKDNPVQGLWRASLLNDTDTLEECASSVASLYEKALEDEDYFEADRLFVSLKECGYKKAHELSKQSTELKALYNKKVPGNTFSDDSSKKKVSQYIDGTVTVLVDKGIKVKKGMGVADKVIGSGFFISKDGYIITNNHVIADMVDPKNEEYSRLYIKLARDSDTKIPAKVVGWDPLIDLALLKTEVEAPYVFNLGSSEDLDVGDKVYAIGSPVGLERTLTSGIVSAVDRKLFSLGSVMQIDAAVNSGNSGGPCIDQNGNVQAVVFAGMLQYEGLNFAIPVEYLKADLPALYHGGKLEHSWINGFGHVKKELGKEAGVEVQYILPGGALNRCGVKTGDVIIELNGKKVKNLEDLQTSLMYCYNSSVVNMKYRTSDDEVKSCSIYLSSRPENPGYIVYNSDILSKSFIPLFGLSLVNISNTSDFKYYISNVIAGSAGDDTGFSENDPVEVRSVKFNDEKTYIFAEVYTKNRKKGYLDISIGLVAALDSPYYF